MRHNCMKIVSNLFHDCIFEIFPSARVYNPRPATLYYAAGGHGWKLCIHDKNYTVIKAVWNSAYSVALQSAVREPAHKKTSSFNHADHSYKLTCQRIPCATLFCPGFPIQPKYVIYNMIRCVFPAAMLLFMPLYCRCHSYICDEFRRPCCCLCRHIAVVIAM
jgi:hypothetical protein